MSDARRFDPAEKLREPDGRDRNPVEDGAPGEEPAGATLDPARLAKWCGECRGRCCRYYTIPIAEPEDADDFDELRWFLAHGGCYVYVDEGAWNINVESRCRFLGPDGRCAIYDHRPDVCRAFGHREECEFVGEFDFEFVFRSIRELEAYAKEVLPPAELARLHVFPDDWTGPA